jgi:low affinity Fe/Cu permease
MLLDKLETLTFSKTNQMTITLSEGILYLAVVLILMIIQVYQLKRIADLQKECDLIWTQVSTIVMSISAKMLEMQKDITDAKQKNENIRSSEVAG